MHIGLDGICCMELDSWNWKESKWNWNGRMESISFMLRDLCVRYGVCLINMHISIIAALCVCVCIGANHTLVETQLNGTASCRCVSALFVLSIRLTPATDFTKEASCSRYSTEKWTQIKNLISNFYRLTNDWCCNFLKKNYFSSTFWFIEKVRAKFSWLQKGVFVVVVVQCVLCVNAGYCMRWWNSIKNEENVDKLDGKLENRKENDGLW